MSECSEGLTSYTKRTSYSMAPSSVDPETASFSEIERLRISGIKGKIETKTKMDFINSMFDELGIDGKQ